MVCSAPTHVDAPAFVWLGELQSNSLVGEAVGNLVVGNRWSLRHVAQRLVQAPLRAHTHANPGSSM